VSDPTVADKHAAMAEEQAHLHRIHDRVESLRRRAEERAAEAAADRSGATFQARYERDVTAHHHASRRARYTFGDVESLAFGRLDLADGDGLHIGRVSVIDEDGDVLLVDWRAPAAAAFYQATSAQPIGVARRRTLLTRGRTLIDLDDELLDGAAADRLGLTAVTGQGALLAALSRERSGRMRDIVATIQGEQDRIIRAPASGTLVVAGGPGTGKTVVALHRVAYLLYRDRDRFEGRGVLVIGPSSAFTEYTARVLPALGEDRAVQRPLAGLAPRGSRVHGWDAPEVGRIKGSLAMVEVLRRTLERALPPIPPTTRFSFQGTTVTVPGHRLRSLRQRHLGRLQPDTSGGAYHDRTPVAVEALEDALFSAWTAAHRAAGHRVPEDRDLVAFVSTIDAAPEVVLLRRCFWPELDPDETLAALATGRIDLADVTEGLLSPHDRDRLVDAWSHAACWTIDDVALLDELVALLGVAPSKRPPPSRREAEEDPGLRLSTEALHVDVAPADVEAEGYRDFAHVVVDEAQDLTPMQWRAVSRRGPYASWTVVGDLAQRSRVAEPASWDEVARLIGRRSVEVATLEVNYRTPMEIADLARDVLEAAGHDPALAPRAVRAAGHRPRHVLATDLTAAAAQVVADLLVRRGGTLAVLSDEDAVPDLRAAVEEIVGPERERVRVLEVREAKGLEFDDVVVVDPVRIMHRSEVGTHQLYVAVTRATRSLTVCTRPADRFPGQERCDVIELDRGPDTPTPR
ncbi:MAG: HelD family protein, partial [Nitriliruptoraceae bacterium]